MKPRSLLAGVALLVFLTTQGICPVPAWALRPSVEGVQSGLEEKLTGLEENIEANWKQTGVELSFLLQVLDRLFSKAAIEKKSRSSSRRKKPPEVEILVELKSIQNSLQTLQSLFENPLVQPIADRERVNELLQAAQGFIQNAWKGLNRLDDEFRDSFPEELSFLSSDQPIYQRMLFYSREGNWNSIQGEITQRGLAPSPTALAAGLEEGSRPIANRESPRSLRSAISDTLPPPAGLEEDVRGAGASFSVRTESSPDPAELFRIVGEFTVPPRATRDELYLLDPMQEQMAQRFSDMIRRERFPLRVIGGMANNALVVFWRQEIDHAIDLSEVLSNAIDAVVDRSEAESGWNQGRVEIALRRQGDTLILEVSDNGIGFTEMDLRDNALRNEFTTKGGGARIGGSGIALLDLCGRNLVAELGGSLEIISRQAGKTETGRLIYQPSNEQEYNFSRADRSETGTAVRWNFPGVFRPSAGLEESVLARALAVAAEAAQGSGVVVIGWETLEARGGLEEFVLKAPPELLRRIVFYAVGKVWAARLKDLNAQAQVIAEEDLSALVPLLLSMPEAEQVTVIGLLALARQLKQILPLTMAVSHLNPDAEFRLILAAMGVSEQVLDQINASGLEEGLARSRAA